MVRLIGTLLVVFFTMAGCSMEQEKTDEEKQAELELKKSPEYVLDNSLPPIEEALKKSLSEKDFSLFGIAGRHVIVPGFPPEKQDEVKAKCGIKPMPGYKDNFKTREERKALKALREYAKEYNLKMYEHCLKNG